MPSICPFCGGGLDGPTYRFDRYRELLARSSSQSVEQDYRIAVRVLASQVTRAQGSVRNIE